MITKNELRKNTINSLLTTNNNAKFIVPEYQRPYVWDEDKAYKLFDDIWEFTSKQESVNTEETYFLGSLVACENRHNIEIIDGQQRITSIFLLLRAIYTRLIQEDSNDATEHLKNRIAPAIWEVDKKTNKPNYKKPLLESKVLADEGNDVLKQILISGTVVENAKDNYSKNYLKYLNLYDEKAKSNRHMLDDFIILLLDGTVLLPIITDKEDIALTIFSTLNDRGMPLTNADKFKAEIYKKLDKSKRKDFINDWKELETNVDKIKDGSMQNLFYYYMFYLRAKEGDNSASTPGLGNFFLADKEKKYLMDSDLLDNLNKVLDFITILELREANESLSWSTNKDIMKSLDILYEYPNEFWKYPVITYYLKYNKKKDFEVRFTKFLHMLIVILTIRYIENPSVNGIKPDIVKLDVDIIKSIHPQFPEIVVSDELREKIVTPHSKLFRMLLAIMAYMEPTQKELLETRKWEIEHILPQKWQKSYFGDEKSDSEIKEIIEHLGNKIPLRKKLNIDAGNNYIDKKVVEYAKSKIKVAYNLRNLTKWSFEQIHQRDADVSKDIINLFRKYIKEYKKIN